MRAVLIIGLFLFCATSAGAQPGDPLHAALDPYAAYQTGVSASMDADISSAGAMDASLMRAAQYDPAQLARGRFAYALHALYRRCGKSAIAVTNCPKKTPGMPGVLV